ncbi:hypothetical protein GOHSU_16_01290 [Gordonia hirsuta DSM 44140 = NBRC 16056]|uniref:BD-FAE-like domain-containing protein n=1 Tax=Gordonia hirsuta DSM 44140 = NBRC 16056 TaxID=1121927 RepID=L7L8U2_9ACTN|nr:alpha/beta hydrolase [Gordonia hirsuta]GAC57171.1 hypothetical protein GOHSU_16_01290 [Gordonia hirsuta DSM 44140 = NBRC 16056]
MPVRRVKIAYGPNPDQFGHLYLPDRPLTEAPGTPLVVMIHGGSWSTEFSLTINTAVARDLAGRGAVVWNIEYRRADPATGAPAAGDAAAASSSVWPRCGNDVIAALEALDGPVADALATAGIGVDRREVAAVGHSAGGHLAVWAVAQLGGRTARHRIGTVVPQSAVLDFTFPGVRDKPSVRRLLGATYEAAPGRYAQASAAQAPVVDALIALVHTGQDESVPVELSRHYAQQAAGRGQRATLVEVPGDHAAFLDTGSPAYRATLRTLGL